MKSSPKLHTLGQLSWENLLMSQECQRCLYKRGTRLRQFEPRDKVLVLLLLSSGKDPPWSQGEWPTVDYEVVCSDRGGTTQIYHLNLLKAWREAEPVSLVTTVTERDDLGPEVPNSSNSTSLLCGDDLTLSQGADVARLRQWVHGPISYHTR